MKIIYMRHAESIDDLTNQYGGWADFELTPHGRDQVHEAVKRVQALDIPIQLIMHSPLKRAQEAACILGHKLLLPLQESVWLKEKNSYGLLSGLEKSESLEQYPDLYKMLNDGYVYGAEREDDFVQRVKLCHKMLIALNKNLLVVTHEGGFISRLLSEVFGKKYLMAHDCGYLVFDTETLQIVSHDGIDFE